MLIMIFLASFLSVAPSERFDHLPSDRQDALLLRFVRDNLALPLTKLPMIDVSAMIRILVDVNPLSINSNHFSPMY